MSQHPPRALLPVATVALALLGACADAFAPTPPSPARATNGSGAEIVRDEVSISFFGGDPRYGLAAIVLDEGASPLATTLCEGGPTAVQGSPQRTQIVFAPNGRVNTGVTSREARIEVYQYGAGIVTSPCDLVGAPIVATGTVQVTQHISDPAASGTGAFVFHLTANGVVDLSSGGQARLRAMVRWVVRPDGTLVMDEEPVQLIPL